MSSGCRGNIGSATAKVETRGSDLSNVVNQGYRGPIYEPSALGYSLGQTIPYEHEPGYERNNDCRRDGIGQDVHRYRPHACDESKPQAPRQSDSWEEKTRSINSRANRSAVSPG